MLTNLKALLQSGPDAHSELGGRALFAKKVMRLAVMGGGYPRSSLDSGVAAVDEGGRGSHSSNGCECNFCGIYNGGKDHAVASAASAYVVDHVPPDVEVIFSGVEVGVKVLSGGALSTCAAKDDPCRQAFIDYEGGPGKSRGSENPQSPHGTPGTTPSIGRQVSILVGPAHDAGCGARRSGGLVLAMHAQLRRRELCRLGHGRERMGARACTAQSA